MSLVKVWRKIQPVDWELHIYGPDFHGHKIVTPPDSVDCVTKQLAAACVKCKVSAKVTKYCSCLRDRLAAIWFESMIGYSDENN